MNITEFRYRYSSDKEEALVLYSVGVHTKSDLNEMVEKLESSQFRTIDLTNNDLVKDHLRHLVIFLLPLPWFFGCLNDLI